MCKKLFLLESKRLFCSASFLCSSDLNLQKYFYIDKLNKTVPNLALVYSIHKYIMIVKFKFQITGTNKWGSPSLSELTPFQISLGLTHFGSETSNYW